MDLLLQSSAADALWAMATVAFYIILAAIWSLRGYYHNNKKRGEELDPEKALPALVSGALVGSAVVWSGQPLNSEYVIAVSGFLIPFLDKVWTMVRTSYDTAIEMHEDGESIESIALEIAQIIDREVDQEDAVRIIEEYERRFGPLDPSHENVQERSEQLRADYESGGVEGAIDGSHQSETGVASVDGPEPNPDDDEDGDLFGRAPSLAVDGRETADDDEVVRDGP